MKVEDDQKFGNINIKIEKGDLPHAVTTPENYSDSQDEHRSVPTATIVTEEEFFNHHGYIFQSELKIELTKLQVQDHHAPSLVQDIQDQSHGNGNDDLEIVRTRKVLVKMTRLSSETLSKVLCPKNVVLKVKKLSAETVKKYSSSSQNATPDNRKSTLSTDSRKLYQCAACSKEYRSRISIKEHLRLQHRTVQCNYPCRICSKSFSHSAALKQHLHTEHMGEKTMDGVKTWKCQFCQMKFFTSQELNVHRGTHAEISFLQCKLCPMNFTNTGHLQSHLREHNRKPNIERPFECYLCNTKFALVHCLQNHMRIHTKKLDCRICLQIFGQEKDLDMHMQTHSGKHRFECNQCSKKFDYRTSFTRHLRIHSGEKPFKCEKCHKTFREKDYLIAHKRTHSADKTIDRTKFTWKYSNEKKFRQSKTNSHDKGKPAGKVFKCKICFKLLKNENELNRHFEGHTGKYLFECEKCGKGFDYRPNLYRHLKTHSGLKNYKCDLCPNRYGDMGSLKAHLRCHNGEKAECDICQRKFSDKGYLHIHKRIHTGEMPFQCTQCKTKYRAKQSLTLHKCYKCDICARYFPTKCDIRKHMSDHLKQGQTNFSLNKSKRTKSLK